MNNRGVIVLALAVLCGLGSMFGVRKVLQGRGSAEVPKQEVLVAQVPILVEETVTEDKVALRALPRDLVPVGALTDIKVARGRWAKIPLMEGDILVDSKLAPKGTPTGMLGKLSPGMRAITLRVDEQTGVSGFILPEYRVDILKAKRDKNSSRARLLLKNVRVLAAGQVIDSPEGRSIQSTTVTVEVTPVQAELLTDAMQDGPLSLALRPMGGPEDSKMPEEPTPDEIPAETALASNQPPPPPPPPLSPAAVPTPPPPPEPVLTRAEPPPPRGRLTIFAGRHQAFRFVGSGELADNPYPASDPPGVRSPFAMDRPTANLSQPPSGTP